jgi:hypothetical protein
MAWFYLSFAGEEGWRGAVIVQALDFIGAIERSNALKINPHGEVAGWEIPRRLIPSKEWRDRLLAKADIEAIPGWGPVRTYASPNGPSRA